MKILCKTKYLELREGEKSWYYAHRANSGKIVIIIPVIKNEKILFLKTKRPPLTTEGYTGYNIELPAGLSQDENKNETLIECAKRELLEETGLKADNIKTLCESLTSSAGLTDEISAVFRADISDDTKIAEPVDDGGVIQKIEYVNITELNSWLKNEEKLGNTIGAQTLASLFLFLCDNK
ncbi:NUDIX hydrolase [bacterium]|nr:NUDIX hydrolase [bacterium]